MKRTQLKYWLEGLAVVAVVGFLLWLSLPRFVQSQSKAKAEFVRQYAEHLANEIASATEPRVVMDKNAHVISMFVTGPAKNSKGNIVTPIITKTEIGIINCDEHKERLPFKNVPADLSNSGIGIYLTYGNAVQNAEPDPSAIQFTDRPFFFCIKGVVNDPGFETLSFFDSPYYVTLDNNGNYNIDANTVIPYDPTNGINSYGEFLYTSENIWELTKAILVKVPSVPE